MNPVLFDTLACHDGHAIGVATLNSAASLNALTPAMITLLHAQLDLWRQDDKVVCVVLRGAGGKAFCAGGDVRALRQALIDHPQPAPHPVARDYFAREYALDFRIHTYDKPLIAWGHGIVMGGGLGLLVGASHRVLTPESRIAMPEITIGLYPDVGGSWFLPRMPARLGLFLALTGASLNANDALFANLSDHILPSDGLDPLLERLTRHTWQNRDRYAEVSALLNEWEAPPSAPSRLLQHFDTLSPLMRQGSLASVTQAIARAEFSDPWLLQAQQGLQQGCPTTAALCWAIFQRAPRMSLAEVLRMELTLSVNLCARPDFSEGVRALLVDKDRQPRWSRGADQIDADWIDSLFASPWPADAHPLRALM